MTKVYDVIIAGTGAMGSAAAAELSQRGLQVLAIDRFTPPHALGSSHGHSRIIREAYYEDPRYVPILQKAYENWERLEAATARRLYLKTGGLMIGPAKSELVTGALRSATTHHLSYRLLTANEIRTQYPAFHVDDDMVAVWEPRAGILFPEQCVAAQLSVAEKHGADFCFDEPVISWQADGKGVSVTTASNKFVGSRLLLAAGSWLPQLYPEFGSTLTIERQVLYWFRPQLDREIFEPGRFPVFIWSYDDEHLFYGFPDLGDGVKVAMHYGGEQTDIVHIDRVVRDGEVDFMRGLLKRYVPGAAGPLNAATVCMYTNTPSRHFYIAPHPQYPQVLVASICSGHGFKFASAFGEILSDLLMGNKSPFDLTLFSSLRFL